MKEHLEKIIMGLLETKRELSLPVDIRPSKEYAQEDAAVVTAPTSTDIRQLGLSLAERYGNPKNTVYLGEVGTTKCNHVIADPASGETPLKFRIKYGNLAEVWKNALFSEYLNSQGHLGWCLSRDWSDQLPHQYYIVMLQGKEPLLQKLVSDAENSVKNMEATIAFLGDYFFGESKEHMKEDKERAIIKAQVDLIMRGMKRTIPFENMMQKDWDEKLDGLRKMIYQNIDKTEGKIYHCRVVSDCIPQNIISLNGANGGDLSRGLAWIDQGYRKELLDGWLDAQGIGAPTREQYFKSFYGTPHFNLGHFYFVLQYADNIPEVSKEHFRTAVMDFIYNGRFGRRLGQGEDSESRVKFTNWGITAQKIAANLFALGELRAAVYNYNLNQRPEEMQRLINVIIGDIMPAGNIYTFAPTLPVKTHSN